MPFDTLNEIEIQEKIERLAKDVLTLSQTTLVMNLRFLDVAISRLKFVPVGFGQIATIAVDGKNIYYNPVWVLKCYKNENNCNVRDYLHMVMHCIFHHAFVGTLDDTDLWDLSCDIAVENTINELKLPCVKCSRESKQTAILNKLKKEVKLLTAEKIYNYLRENELSEDELFNWRLLFTADEHEIWYNPAKLTGAGGNFDNNGENKDTEDNSGCSNGNNCCNDGGAGNDNEEDLSPEALRNIWKDIAEHMQTDLETFSQQRGNDAGGLMQNLRAVTREKYDYSDFLRRFAVMGEAMKINDDEFDYIFYTYGMQLYEKMPLIEPLEYKDVKRIKEFVIAIDTSGSVEGDLVQTFLQKTYNILMQEESFFTKINLHIIQCDAKIQHDVKITSQKEFDEYIKKMELYGFGGTDFCPVFNYVERLRNDKEFTNLKGLIYFTDGYGTFPNYKPDFETAFVFIDDEYGNPNVPRWAIKLVLQKEDI